MNVLIGDLGGTKTILAIVSDETGPNTLLHEKTFSSPRHDCLEAIISVFLAEVPLVVDRACLAVAGPVTNGHASITNLPWDVDSEKVRATFNLSGVTLINDLEAVAYAIPILQPADVYTLRAGVSVERGNIAVIAPGTGLGEAFLSYDGSAWRANASEGSHASFGPINAIQTDLLTFMRETKGFDHVSFERVCSGALGIPNLYDFFKSTGRKKEPDWLARKLAECDDPTPIIVEAALEKENPCDICTAALNLFCEILAAEAGNLALKVLSTGGLYLGGGITPRILDELRKPGFLEIIQNKGRLKGLLSRMPVRVILNTRAGLLGAAARGLSVI